ncbi:MAG: phage virion morphogenesis protein [Rhodanobacter sp.]
MITIELDDRDVAAAMRGLAQQLGNLRPAYQDIGEYLITSTRRRFASGTGPDGVPWMPNTALTLSRKKGTKPLIGETRRLGSEIALHVDNDSASVGSNLIYAAPQQFGALRGQYGRTKRNGPIPWGNIPARPFIGVSNDDATAVLDIVSEHIQSAFDNATS